MTSSSTESQPVIMTVKGPIPLQEMGITDGHNHIWIDAVPGVDTANPVLDQFAPIAAELTEYFLKGGRSLLDCQPHGCGRNGSQLLALSKASGVNVVACTGFHRRKYYPPQHAFWRMNAQQVADFLIGEIRYALSEIANEEIIETVPVKAGFIKIALEADWADCLQAALEGAAAAACETHLPIEVHTEKGALAEEICQYLVDRQVSPRQLILCHMDKRPDVGLHKTLAEQGVLLEYDTFYRPKYEPQKNLWSLIDAMASAGFVKNIVLATDMAERVSYHFIGNGPGLASLPGEIQEHLRERGIPEQAIRQILGANIASCLAGINY